MRNLFDLQTPVKHGERKKTFSLFFLAIAFLGIVFFSLKNNAPVNEVKNNIPVAIAADSVPPVQMFVPGFSVKQLPVSLTNINVLRYGPDGRLYALAYDGHIYVLTDTNGDGLEDKVETWWGKNLFMMPVGMVVTKDGIYVTSYNKVSLLKDTDHDGKGDTEEVLTKDWVKPFVYTGNSVTGVDAMGIAKDKDGNIFFALGTADFTNAYSIDSTGKSHYDIHSERGTILKLAPGSSKREIYCTGTRFPVAMAFNSQGDLFATDQEGATWLPNGNPLDELLNIQPDRHYGFPPRHPKYLPNVIDEPSVFDYAPQHQSTCGINFDVPINGGPVFGPEWWKDDALVAGFSRGKLFRTTLTKTPSGYVAKNAIIGSVTSLTVDAAPSPNGDLVISTHAGPPDWGYGPGAKGKLYKVFYTNKQLPSPVSAWAINSNQVKIAFDKPLPKDYLVNLADKIQIEYGQYVGTGDRFEVFRPGYKAVERQRGFPRHKLGIKSVELSDDGRTLTFNTFTHVDPVIYAVTLPDFKDDKKLQNSINQVPAVDLSYSLNGVDVSWEPNSGSEKWAGTIPHLDLGVSEAFLKPVSDFANFSKILSTPGKVKFKTKLNLFNMLRPNTQPESTLDYKLPPEDVNLVFLSSEPLDVKATSTTASASVKQGDLYKTEITFKGVEKQAYDLEVGMNTSGKPAKLEVYYTTNEDSRPRALQVSRFYVPWLKEIFNNEDMQAKDNPQLAGGNWAAGKKLFYGQAMCSSCHSVGGKGHDIGPDLSNLVFRDYESVLRDIHNPSATINPDYVAYTVTLKNKKSLIGMVSYTKEAVIVRDVTGTKTSVPLKNVASVKALGTSLMPVGLDVMLGKQKMKDLLTFLLTNITPAKISLPFLPPMRNAAEMNALLRDVAVPAATLPKTVKGKTTKAVMKPVYAIKPFRILWVSGPKDHGPNAHDYPVQQQRWSQILSLAENVTVTKTNQWPTQEQFDNNDLIIFYWDYQQFTEENGKQLDAFQQRGGGLVYLHYAVDATQHPEALANRIGMAWKGGAAKFREGPLYLQFTDSKNPIIQGFKSPLVLEDEVYWQLTPGSRKIDVLATSNEDGKPQPILWTSAEGKGRVFVCIMGHYSWTFDDPIFRTLIFRGISWAGHQPLDRFNDEVTIGARMSK